MATAIQLTPINMADRAKMDFRAGDTVRVWSKIQEKGKTRLQAFEGLVLSRKHGKQTTDAMFTVRKISNSVGVERIFPLYSPMIDKIEVIRKSKTRRSKLYFIRDKAAKEIRKKMKSIFNIAIKDDAPEEKEESSEETQAE
ncbi:MAG: 50S ribosomal protein L19 [Candidatus Paceibacterota bacterium]|jgi:large subunit ribosomal protein L19